MIVRVIKEYKVFAKQGLSNIPQVNTHFAIMIPKVIHWLHVDFSPLHKPRYDYKKQARMDTHQVNMANATMVHFGLDPGKFVRWLRGKYTGQHCDIQALLHAVQNRISPNDYNHMKQILLDGSPSQLKFDGLLMNKLK
jgi:hypothetical protein